MSIIKVKDRPKTYEAILVAEDNLPHAARMISDHCTTDAVRKYIGAYIVKKSGSDLHICCKEDFEKFYSAIPEIAPGGDIIAALEWAKQQLGKRTRPDPIDDVLSKLR